MDDRRDPASPGRAAWAAWEEAQGAVLGHWVGPECGGETCRPCFEAGVTQRATHKLGEEISALDPNGRRHPLTAYVCCGHFRLIVGPAAPCRAA